jgi:hypothetical protein
MWPLDPARRPRRGLPRRSPMLCPMERFLHSLLAQLVELVAAVHHFAGHLLLASIGEGPAMRPLLSPGLRAEAQASGCQRPVRTRRCRSARAGRCSDLAHLAPADPWLRPRAQPIGT